MVGRVGYEAFWDFVEGDSDAGLEADGEEDVGWDVVVVLRGAGCAGGWGWMGVRVGVGVGMGVVVIVVRVGGGGG